MMKKSLLYYLMLLILGLVSGRGDANAQDSLNKVRAFLEKTQTAYRAAGQLAFHVKYIYANAGQADRHLDSLSGEVEIDKGRSRFVIDGTETLVTSKYAIHVVTEDKLIYLSKPTGSGMMDPAGLVDSMLAHMEGMQTRLETQRGAETLTIRFPPGKGYTMVRMTMNSRTGLLERVVCDLKTAAVVGEEMVEQPGHPGPYQPEGRVEIYFSGYTKGGFGEELFNEEKFFTRVGDRFIPAERYKDYHIFLASSHL
jgi:hypothetical protein